MRFLVAEWKFCYKIVLTRKERQREGRGGEKEKIKEKRGREKERERKINKEPESGQDSRSNFQFIGNTEKTETC